MSCHIRDTIDSQMWHYSRTFVKRSTHVCGTTFFSAREKYILESDDYETQKFSPLLNNFSHAHRIFRTRIEFFRTRIVRNPKIFINFAPEKHTIINIVYEEST